MHYSIALYGLNPKGLNMARPMGHILHVCCCLEQEGVSRLLKPARMLQSSG
jgi:hypothetical protein